MRTAWFLAILFLGTPAAGMAGASERPTPTVADILEAWSKRAKAVEGGEVRWTTSADQRNSFGRCDTEWASTSDQSDQEISGSVRFDQDEARYDGKSSSYVDFVLSPAKQKNEHEFFFQALLNEFSDPAAEYRELLSYTIFYTSSRRIHFWHGGSDEYPRAVVLPVASTTKLPSLTEWTGFNADSVYNLSGSPSAELHEWLAAPIFLAYRPGLFDRGILQASNCRVDEAQRPMVEGRECRVLHVIASATEDPPFIVPVERVYWVDPSRDFLVVRAYLMVPGFFPNQIQVSAQLDIDYERVKGGGWTPSAWTVMRLDLFNPFFVQQVVSARRTHIDLRPEAAREVSPSYTPGTWVKDRVAGGQFFVGDDLCQQEIHEPYPMAYRYTDLVKQFGGKNPSASWYRPKNLRRVLLDLIQWPKVLIPVTAILGVLFLVQVVRRFRRRRRDDLSLPFPILGEEDDLWRIEACSDGSLPCPKKAD